MSGWRQFAESIRDEAAPRDNRDERDKTPAIPIRRPEPAPKPALDPVSVLRDWHERLSDLDFNTAPGGFDLRRWRELIEDAYWIYENFASRLVREGWSAHDVFGVLPWREGGGVLLDRLQGVRNLELDGEGRARWSSYSVGFITCRGASAALMSSGLVLVWELPDHG